jgi:hypothetical protein
MGSQTDREPKTLAFCPISPFLAGSTGQNSRKLFARWLLIGGRSRHEGRVVLDLPMKGRTERGGLAATILSELRRWKVGASSLAFSRVCCQRNVARVSWGPGVRGIAETMDF